jgi:hypothetical protein
MTYQCEATPTAAILPAPRCSRATASASAKRLVPSKIISNCLRKQASLARRGSRPRPPSTPISPSAMRSSSRQRSSSRPNVTRARAQALGAVAEVKELRAMWRRLWFPRSFLLTFILPQTPVEKQMCFGSSLPPHPLQWHLRFWPRSSSHTRPSCRVDC